MRIFRSIEDAAGIQNPVVTTGSFDGVHVGHKAIIARLNKLAEDVRGESVLITFHPHPRKVLYPDTEGKDLHLINSQEEKIYLLEETGLKNLIILPFTKDFARTTSFDFVKNLLLDQLKAKIIVVGFNHHFGYNREGDYSYLYTLGKSYGFIVEEIPEQEIQNETVSSTKIRKALCEGNIQRANAYLDNFYRICGELFPGNETLSGLGFPSFRIQWTEEIKLIPPTGVYAIRLRTQTVTYKGMASVSQNIQNKIRVEFYILDSQVMDEFPQKACILFHKRLRDLHDFASIQEMKEQLLLDKNLIDELIF